MVLLDGGGWQARDANAVTPHFHELRLAVLIQKSSFHRLAVFGAEVKHMAYLNAALNRQHTLAVRRRVTRDHIAQISDEIGFGQVTTPVHAGDVKVGFIGTTNPVVHHRHFAVHHQFDGFQQVHGTQITRLAAKVVFNFGHGGKTKGRQTRQFADLDLVHVMVTTQQQQPDLSFDHLALVAQGVGRQHQRFDRGLQGHAQQFGHVSTGAFARRWDFRHGLAGGSTRASGGQRLGFFHIGRVITARTVDDGIFAGGGNHLEFFAQITADGTAVGSHRTVGQTKAVKNTPVGFGHDLVAGFG